MIPTMITQCPQCKLTPLCKRNQHEAASNGFLSNKSKSIKRGDLLHDKNDTFKCLYIVRSGALKSFDIDANGKERIRRFYFAGEIIGLDAIHAGQYSAICTAITSAKVCILPYTNLLDCLTQHPALQAIVIAALSYHLDLDHYLTAPQAEQRVAAFLLDLQKRSIASNCNHLCLPMSRVDIANFLDLAPETVSRVLSKFQQEKWIHSHLKQIHLLNKDALSRISQGASIKEIATIVE